MRANNLYNWEKWKILLSVLLFAWTNSDLVYHFKENDVIE